jgi:hypothetical protein
MSQEPEKTRQQSRTETRAQRERREADEEAARRWIPPDNGELPFLSLDEFKETYKQLPVEQLYDRCKAMWDKIKATQADAQQKILAEKNLVTALAQELVTIRAEYRAREAASRSATPAEPQWNATEGRQPSIGLESALTQADKPPQRSVKVPDPPELTDGKSPKYQNWLLQMKNKLRANHDHYPDKAAKVAYIYGRTKDDASNLLYPHL